LPQRSRVKPQSLSSRCGRIPVILNVGATAKFRKFRLFADGAANGEFRPYAALRFASPSTGLRLEGRFRVGDQRKGFSYY
jgi:hypothetical protein